MTNQHIETLIYHQFFNRKSLITPFKEMIVPTISVSTSKNPSYLQIKIDQKTKPISPITDFTIGFVPLENQNVYQTTARIKTSLKNILMQSIIKSKLRILKTKSCVTYKKYIKNIFHNEVNLHPPKDAYMRFFSHYFSFSNILTTSCWFRSYD